MAPPRQPPELVADIVGEILLLLPPADPASLVRASLVCKLWRRLLSNPAFRRRYRAFHGAPPLLGFLHDHYAHGAVAEPRFVPTVAPSPIPQPALGCRDWSVIDCRHGRVLFDIFGYRVSLVVWDAVTGGRHFLPDPPISRLLYGAAVICAVRGCDHLDCHGGPFLVLLTALDVTGSVMQVQMYSSAAGAWKLSAHQDLRHHVARKPSTLIGDDIYFRLDSASTALLRYDLGKNRLSTIDAPASHSYEGGFAIMPMVDGSLGFADIRGSELCLWSKNVDTEVSAGWEQRAVIELETLIPESFNQAYVVGFEEGGDVMFVSNDVGVFTIELNSGRVEKISEPGHYDAVFPFMSYYTKII
ncbi:hypothetical protein SETIT_2G020100v2 [Setaria italica]|uniref:F-box domain-containing protein n=1 Tax=Setaria italica TaxID=4555 RepID=A0A368PUZ2_SETIT|nr:hypothetical protein SETIT_2G020100v2 [Setaria italica]